MASITIHANGSTSRPTVSWKPGPDSQLAAENLPQASPAQVQNSAAPLCLTPTLFSLNSLPARTGPQGHSAPAGNSGHFLPVSATPLCIPSAAKAWQIFCEGLHRKNFSRPGFPTRRQCPSYYVGIDINRQNRFPYVFIDKIQNTVITREYYCFCNTSLLMRIILYLI